MGSRLRVRTRVRMGMLIRICMSRAFLTNGLLLFCFFVRVVTSCRMFGFRDIYREKLIPFCLFAREFCLSSPGDDHVLGPDLTLLLTTSDAIVTRESTCTSPRP